VTLPLSYSRLRPSTRLPPSARSGLRRASPPDSLRSAHGNPLSPPRLRGSLPRVRSRSSKFFVVRLCASRCSATTFTWLANRSPPPREALRRAKVGGEGRIRTSEAAGATDLQSAAFDRFATSPISSPLRSPKKSKLREASPRAPHALAALRANCLDLTVTTSPAELPEIPCRARFIHLRSVALRRTSGAGEGIRTPDRLITNQLLYRTELRQPRQKVICSTRRATGATTEREKGQVRREKAIRVWYLRPTNFFTFFR
jgi:hypothetical protein